MVGDADIGRTRLISVGGLDRYSLNDIKAKVRDEGEANGDVGIEDGGGEDIESR